MYETPNAGQKQDNSVSLDSQVWRSTENSTSFTRSLGALEYKFYLDQRFNGTADNFIRMSIKLENGFQVDQQILDNAWRCCRSKLPMLATHIVPANDRSSVRFTIDLNHVQTDSVELIEGKGSGDQLVLKLLGSERTLDDQHQSRCFVTRDHQDADVFEVFCLVSHSIGDGISSIVMAKAFCDALASRNPPPMMSFSDLEALLRVVPSADVLIRQQLGSKYHWQSAAGKYLFYTRMSKLQGGSSLPRTVTESTSTTPARSKHVRVSVDSKHATIILSNCKKHGLTFGTVLPVLTQVALARVLHSSEKYKQDLEWEKRLRSPWHIGGPASLRRYIDWSGQEQVLNVIGYTEATLPPLPRPSQSSAINGPKSFADLLSSARFLHRSRMVSKQYSDLFLRHPLLLMLCKEFGEARTPHAEATLAKYEGRKPTSTTVTPVRSTPVINKDSEPFVFAHIVSSWGNIDTHLPPHTEGDNAIFDVIDIEPHLRCRPTEFYIIADSFRGNLRFRVQYDANVYTDELVHNILQGVKEAAMHYLL